MNDREKATDDRPTAAVGRPKVLSDIDFGRLLAYRECGLTNLEIGRRLGIHESTVRKYFKKSSEIFSADEKMQ